MAHDVTLELTAAEALIALGPIQDRACAASQLAAISTGEEHEIADLSFKLLTRIAGMIVDALYPEDASPLYPDEDIHVDNREGDPAFNGAFNRW